MARNTKMLEARNQNILDRYIYWTEERRVRFDDAISILSKEEFFLSEVTLMDIIRNMLREGKTASNGTKATELKFIGFKVMKKVKKPSEAIKQTATR